MIEIMKLSEVKDLEKYIIITPSNKEIFYKYKYIKNNYNIVSINNFIMDSYTGSRKIASDFASYIIMDKVYKSLKEKLKYYNNISSNSFVNNLVSTYNTFYDYKLNNNEKIEDLKIIFNEYEKSLELNGYITINMLYKNILKDHLFERNYLFLDFDDFSDNELLLLSKMGKEGNVLLILDGINNNVLSRKLASINVNFNYDEYTYNHKKVNYKSLNDISDEVSFVSNDISKRIIEGTRYEDILIVCPNINTYRPYFELYLNHPYNKTENKGILTDRFIKLFCNVLKGDFTCKTFLELLKLGIFDIDLKLVDKLDNYIYSWDLEDKDFYLPFTYNPNGNKKNFSAKDEDDLSKINDAKDGVIIPLKYLLENVVGINDKKELLRILYTYFLEEKIIDNLFLKDEDGVLKLILLFENMNDYMNAKVSIDEILNILQNNSLLTDKKIDMQDSICVKDFTSALYEGKKYIYLLGMINTDMPYQLSLPNLINNDDVDKEDLIIKLEEKENYSYHLFSKAIETDNIMITYPKLSSDLKLTEKCLYLNNLSLEEVNDNSIYDKNEMLKKYSILLSEDKIKKEDNKYFDKINKSNIHNLNYKLNKDVVYKLYTSKLNISPSSIETYFGCPFYYFCQYGLRLKVKEKYTFDNREVGTFVHYILENIIKNDIDKVSVKTIDDYVFKYAKNYLEENGKISNNTTRYVIKALSKNASLVIKNIVNEMDVTKFRPTYFEFKIDEESIVKPLEIKINNNVLKIGGVVDRVDTYTSDNNFYYRIIDYKTGQKNFRLDDVLDGLNLQMLVYLLAIKESNISNLNIVPSALLYYPALVKEKLSSRSYEDKEDTVKAHLKMNGIVHKDDINLHEKMYEGTYINMTSYGRIDEQKVYGLDDLNKLFDNIKTSLEKMGREIYEGNISASPIGGRLDACTYCKYSSICKFDDKVDKKRKPLDYKNREVFNMLGGDFDA